MTTKSVSDIAIPISEQNRHITLIAGPTASGKSQLALEIAAQYDSVIINADSMQVYADLHILTARPSKAEMSQVPHVLYGFVDGIEAFSVGHWLERVHDLLNDLSLRQKKLIIVGGTGLYFRGLSGGLAAMPEIPAHIRNFWRKRLSEEGAAKLYDELKAQDPTMAVRLQPGDGQRIIRALEILDLTGKSLVFWQMQKSLPLIDMEKAQKILLLPEREKLYSRINHRFNMMMVQGARDEVQNLLARHLDPQLPVMKAIGVRELGEMFRGEMSEDEALERAKQETRRYAKRQISWLRNQMAHENWQIFTDKKEILHNF